MSIALRNDVLVIDASTGYRLFIPHQDQTLLELRLYERLGAGWLLTAPTLWRYELTSAITKAIQHNRVSHAEAAQAFALSLAFPIELVTPSDELARAAFQWTLKLKRAAAYDSFYLALAQQLQCELWTYDQRLANAVSEPWVHYLGQTR
jgi:predicted nucleic acid-binding protein